MTTIEEHIDSLKPEDLESQQTEVSQPLKPIELPLIVVKWIAKKVARDKYSDFEIASMANEKLADFGLNNVGYPNPIKAKAHVERIRKARCKSPNVIEQWFTQVVKPNRLFLESCSLVPQKCLSTGEKQ
jgi:hypothetical protein